MRVPPSLILVLVLAAMSASCGDDTGEATTTTGDETTTTSTSTASTMPGATPTSTTTTSTTTSTTSTTTSTTTTTTLPGTTTTTAAASGGGTTTSTIPPGNRPPTASITSPAHNSGPYDVDCQLVNGRLGASIQFTGTASDPDGDSFTVQWFASENQPSTRLLGTGTSITGRLELVGDSTPHQVTMRATDQWGASFETSITVTVWMPSGDHCG